MYPLSSPAGSISNPFTNVSDFPISAPHVGYEVFLTYVLSPTGYVKWFWNGTAFKLSSDQVIINYGNADGSPIYDQTATLLTPGTAYDLWTSDILPPWLLTAGFRGALVFEAGFMDTSSTASVTIRAGIGDSALGGTDPATSLLGFTSAAASANKGFTMAPANFRISGGDIFSVAGSAPFSQGQNSPRSLFQLINSPRIRFNAIPGAITNRFRIWSVTLKTGPC